MRNLPQALPLKTPQIFHCFLLLKEIIRQNDPLYFVRSSTIPAKSLDCYDFYSFSHFVPSPFTMLFLIAKN